MMGVMVSPLRGADGNIEFLLHLRRHRPGPGDGHADRSPPSTAGRGPGRRPADGSS